MNIASILRITHLVITNGRQEAINLHNLMGDKKFEETIKDFYGINDKQDYGAQWIWIIEPKGVDKWEFSGSSGYNALNNTISRYPGSPIYNYAQFYEEYGPRGEGPKATGGEILKPASVALVYCTSAKVYWLQTIFAGTERHFYARISQSQAEDLSESEGLEIVKDVVCNQ